MNAKLFTGFVVAGLLGTVVGCGDSTSTGGAGGTPGAGGATTSTGGQGTGGTPGTGGTVATGGQGGTPGTGGQGGEKNVGGAGACQGQCEKDHTDGFKTFSQAETESCGCAAASPCNNDCKSDPACTDNKPNEGNPVDGSACATCLQAEGAKGAASTCTFAAATGATCQADQDCADFVTCGLMCN